MSETKGFYETKASAFANIFAEALSELQGDLRGMREMALLVLKFKFGPLPEAIETRLNAIEEPDKAKINVLAASVLHAKSLDDLVVSQKCVWAYFDKTASH